MRAAVALLVLVLLAALHTTQGAAVLATPALNNTTRLASYLQGNFTAANITKPNALESRVEAGVVPAVDSSTELSCTVHLVGQGITTAVDVTSVDPSTQATGLDSASVSCTGPTGATFQGGSALADFTSNFTGTRTCWQRSFGAHYLQVR